MSEVHLVQEYILLKHQFYFAMVRCLLLVILLLNDCDGVFYKSNSTDLTKCSTISYSRSGSKYREFYPVSFKPDGENGSLILDFHFAVLATSDAHILLAPSDNITKQDPAYEIVIGAGGNTFTDIRRKQKSDVKASINIKGLLSALDPRFFWIHLTKVGTQALLEVGKEGNTTSLISWLDPKPLLIRVISFSTWTEIEAKWYFDCDRSGNEEEIEKKLTTLERLRRNLLTQYDPMVRPVQKPDDDIQVYVAMKFDSMDLDERNSILNVRGTAKLTWNDMKLNWLPENYTNIRTLHIFRNEIWRPELYCMSATSNSLNLFDDSLMVVTYQGNVTWNTNFQVNVFCNSLELNKWPKGNHECLIQLSSVEVSSGIFLGLNKNDSSLILKDSSQWIISDTEVVDAFLPSLIVNFNVTRSSTVYSDIFFSPLLIISSFLLLSFWVSPKGHMKILMGCAQLIIETLMLITLGSLTPTGYEVVPFLTLLYSWSMVATSISILISIMVINVSRIKHYHPLSHIASNILTTKCIKACLCLPDVVMPDEYGHLGCNSLSKIEDKVNPFWLLLGVAIDRIAFIIYFSLAGYLIAAYIFSYY